MILHQNSVNARYDTIPFPWLVFGEKVKVNTVFLRDSTGISDSMLILFGGAVNCGVQVMYPGCALLVKNLNFLVSKTIHISFSGWSFENVKWLH